MPRRKSARRRGWPTNWRSACFTVELTGVPIILYRLNAVLCRSRLAGDAGGAVSQGHRAESIASKPAPTGGAALFGGDRREQFAQRIWLALERPGEYITVFRHVDAGFFHLLLAQRGHGFLQDFGQQLGQFEHFVMTVSFGFIHEQTLQISAAAVYHFDGHSPPHMPSR